MSPLEDVEDNGTVATAMRAVSENPDLANARRPEDIPVRNTPMKQASSSQLSNSASRVATQSNEAAVSREQAARLYAQQQAALQSIRGEFDFLAVPDWVMLHPLLGAYLAEGIGTFAFVLTVALVEVNNVQARGQKDTNMTCLPIGMMLMCMVFTFGYISGGHFNPAVTIAVALSRKIDMKRAIGYIIAQCGAAFGAGIVAMIIQGNNDIVVPKVSTAANGTYVLSSSMFAELIYTFALATVILNVAYSVQKGNFFYGFAIGMTITAGAASAGSISGGAFNPALATGLQFAVCMTGKCEAVQTFWLYWVAPVFGACVSALLFSQMAQPEDSKALSEDQVV